MSRRRTIAELESIAEAGPGGSVRRRDDLDPVSRSVLNLQRTAGNRAVATAVSDPRTVAGGARERIAQLLVAQREPGSGQKGKQAKQPPPPPPWIKDAQAIINDMAKSDKLLGHVVIKNYADTNKVLAEFDEYGAWTNSATEIFVKDPLPANAKRDDPKMKAQIEIILRFELQHEANHVRQFAREGGPPKTWQKMLEFEREAYTNDLKFLQGAGKKLVKDKATLADITRQVTKNLDDVEDLLDGIAKLDKKTNVEQHLWEKMKALKLIPSGADIDPTKLYKQP